MATPARFSTKPHVFDGTDFSHWCSRMQSYIMAEDYDIWRKVSHPYVIPEAINTTTEKTAFEQNCKARNILLSGISRSDYDRVAHLQTAHEIWTTLSNFHQETNNIKELRRDLFKKEYIKFEMKPGEALDDYLSRFNKILSDLRSVDSSYYANYPQSEISRHFLNSLDMSIWEMKVTSIQESVNMSTLILDSLHTKLKTHEMNVLSRKVDYKSSALVSSSSSLDVDASSSKSSFLSVFNATSDDQLEQIEEEDLALLANIIARAMNNARNRKRGGPNRCFECDSIDHLRSHCPKLGKGKREDKDGEKTNNNKPNNNKSKDSSQGRKLNNLRKAFQQVYAVFEPLSDVDGEIGDDDKGKNISDVCFMARGESHTYLMFNMISAKKLKQPYDVLDCSTCNLNKMKMKDALGRVEFMEDVVKNNEVLFCPKCRKSKGVMVDCENCANLENDVSYLKNSLLRFSDGKKNLNMLIILDILRGLAHIIKDILLLCLVLVLEVVFPRGNRPDCSGSRGQTGDRSDRLNNLGQIGGEASALVARKENMWIVDSGCSRHMTGDKNWFSSLKKASKAKSTIFGDAATSAVLATGMVKVNEKFELKNVALVEDLKLGHVGFDHLTRLSGLDVVRGLPKLKKDLDLVHCHRFKRRMVVFLKTRATTTTTTRSARPVRPGARPVRPAQEVRSDRPWSSAEGSVDAVRDGPLEITTSTSNDTERGSTSEVAAPLHIQRRHPPEQIIGNIGERTTRSKVEGLDFDETFAPVARIEAIRLLLAFAALKDFKLYQMDVKSAFLNGFIQEEVYVKQPPDFAETMHKEFEMSMMGELSYFLGLQIKQTPQGTFVHQTKYTKDLLRWFKMENCKPISTPIGSTAVLDPDEDSEAVDQKEYRSMIGSLLYLIAYMPDIQFDVCLCARFQASPHASHRQAVKRIMSCCSQILWLLSTLKDYGLTFEKVPLFCDNTSAINIAKNPVQHSRTKHMIFVFTFEGSFLIAHCEKENKKYEKNEYRILGNSLDDKNVFDVTRCLGRVFAVMDRESA
uniref:OSJNBb0013O03.2 protein n=1 Tax=Oryza sativa subsp. japonica TaxID=39947 RepID=Q7XW16_ORYSJ|nr:OSJNBb0013O03.2 [Oryza sativa Japonica Group]